jgi:hypothetical protein
LIKQGQSANVRNAEAAMKKLGLQLPGGMRHDPGLMSALVHVLGGEHSVMASGCIADVEDETRVVGVVVFQRPAIGVDLWRLKNVGDIMRSAGGPRCGAEFLAAAAMGEEQPLDAKLILLCECVKMLESPANAFCQRLQTLSLSELARHFSVALDPADETNPDPSFQLDHQIRMLMRMLAPAILEIVRSRQTIPIQGAMAALRKLNHPAAQSLVAEMEAHLQGMYLDEDLSLAAERLEKSGFLLKIKPVGEPPVFKLVDAEGFVPDKHADALREYVLAVRAIGSQWAFLAICHFLFVRSMRGTRTSTRWPASSARSPPRS